MNEKNVGNLLRIDKLKKYLDMLYKRHGCVPLDIKEAIQKRIRLIKKL